MIARRRVVKGYAQVPNSVIENLHLLTHAELALALLVVRRGGPEKSVKISEGQWHASTGLSLRALEYAAAGLKKKCFEVQGRGRDAQYAFRFRSWATFVQTAAAAKVRTDGRSTKAVAPRPGSMVHPACRDNGCAMMAAEIAASPAVATSNPQPVAQAAAASGCGSPPTKNPGLRLIPLPATSNPQPVAETLRDPVEQVWPKTLAFVQSLFPLAGAAFLARLVGSVSAVHRNVSDVELCQAVQVAWKWKQKIQQSEGLFILTVPNALASVRQVKDAIDDPRPELSDATRRLIEVAVKSLEAHGDTFADAIAQLKQLGDGISGDTVADAVNLEKIERTLEAIETDVVKRGTGLVDAAAVESHADDQVSRWAQTRGRGEIPLTLSNDLRSKARVRRVLELLNCPRLSLFYA